MNRLVCSLALLALPFAVNAGTKDLPLWEFDVAHTNINFSVIHLGLNRVSGSFGEFSGRLYFDPEMPDQGSVKVEIGITSINTNNDKRDDHLRTDDFFDVPSYPKATFESTEWKSLGDNRFHIRGNLTIMETTREVELEAELIGTAEVRGVLKSGWSAKATLDRYDWGVGGRSPFPIGREIQLEFSVQADRK